MSTPAATDSPAPLFRDAFRLAEWLLARLADDPRPLAGALARSALLLLEEITLALRGSDRVERVFAADDRLAILRVELRLAGATGLLREGQAQHALTIADTIGRQLGGWQRRLAGVSSPAVGP